MTMVAYIRQKNENVRTLYKLELLDIFLLQRESLFLACFSDLASMGARAYAWLVTTNNNEMNCTVSLMCRLCSGT